MPGLGGVARVTSSRCVARVAALLLIICGELNAVPARSQDNPGVDEIVRLLTPPPEGPRTRGIRIGDPARAVPAVSLNILFATGSAQLTPEAIRTLNDLGRALTNPALTIYRFRLEGHTDTVGGRDYNQVLSDRRAIAVANYLAGTFNVERGRLQPIGMGQEGLLIPTPDEVPEPRNRRVLVVNIGGSANGS